MAYSAIRTSEVQAVLKKALELVTAVQKNGASNTNYTTTLAALTDNATVTLASKAVIDVVIAAANSVTKPRYPVS